MHAHMHTCTHCTSAASATSATSATPTTPATSATSASAPSAASCYLYNTWLSTPLSAHCCTCTATLRQVPVLLIAASNEELATLHRAVRECAAIPAEEVQHAVHTVHTVHAAHAAHAVHAAPLRARPCLHLQPYWHTPATLTLVRRLSKRNAMPCSPT